VAHEEKLIVIDKIFGAVAQKDKALNKRGKNLRRNQKKKEIYFTKINLMLTRGICVNVDMRGGGNARNGGGGPVRRDISVDALVFEDPFLIFAFDFALIFGGGRDLLSKCSHREQHAQGGFCTSGIYTLYTSCGMASMEERSRRSRGTKPQKASATMNVSVPYSFFSHTHSYCCCC
jgi:hypothetical protein